MQDSKSKLEEPSHRRYNPLTGDYVLCSPHRVNRPWQGNLESPQLGNTKSYEEKCYLCPSNFRVDGKIQNTDYKGVFVFDNDFSAVKKIESYITEQFSEDQENDVLESRLLKSEKVYGVCKVICYSEDHSKTLATLDVQGIQKVVETWKEINTQYKESCDSSEGSIKYVQIFENKGEAMGCSNPHPHGQVWCTSNIPSLVSTEIQNFDSYYENNCSCMLCDTVNLELKKKIRILDETEHFLAIVPYWAAWPFEVLILSKIHISNLSQFDKEHVEDLAKMVKYVTLRYDNLFRCMFPYSMGIHQSPLVGEVDKFHFHMHFYPPLLRNQLIRKWMVGYEMLGESQRDITPEMAAEKLKEQSNSKHYLEN